MNTLAFTYTKKDGSTSNRVLLVMTKPSTHYAGVDISELSERDQGLYIAAMTKLHEEYLSAIQDINQTFDVKHRYRQFDPKLMQIHTTEEI